MKTTAALATAALATVALAAPMTAQAAAPAAASATPTAAASKLTGLPSAATQRNPRAKGRMARTRLGSRAMAKWVYDGTLGRPGAFTAIPAIQVNETMTAYGPVMTVMNAAGPTVSRSPATGGAQNVVVVYSLQVYNGRAWVQQSSAVGSAVLPAGYGAVRLPALVQRPHNFQFRGYTRVVQGVYWYVSGTNTMLGGAAIVPHVASDQVCVSRRLRCASYNGFLHIG